MTANDKQCAYITYINGPVYGAQIKKRVGIVLQIHTFE